MEVNLEYGRVFEETFAAAKELRDTNAPVILDEDGNPEPVSKNKYRIVINRGGSASGKTYALCQYFLTELLQLDKTPKVISIIRETQNANKKGAMRDWLNILNSTGLYQTVVGHNKTESIFTFPVEPKRGQVQNIVEFFSVQEENRIRGPRRTHVWLNEANRIDFSIYRQLSMRTSGQIFLDFNPDDEFIWINTELEQKRSGIYNDVKVIVSNYKDNPFNPPEVIKDIEYLRVTDAAQWQIFGLGEYGKIRGVVFENYQVVNKIPGEAKLIGYGLDFGFTNDPTAMVGVWMQGGELFIKEFIYARGMTNPEIADEIKEFGINRNTEIIADSSEPKSIEEIYRLGVNIKGALKGPDSINASITTLKRFKMNITADSTNLLSELRTYKWKEDKKEQPLNEPVDFKNHAIDALRYVALNKIQPVQPRGGVIKIRQRID